MLVTKRSTLTGIMSTRNIDVTPEQLSKWESGAGLIQNVLPHLSADDREFLMSGITPEEWDAAFKDPCGRD